MSRNLGYTRKFIILKKDYCNMGGQNPKGHGKLEIRGIKGNISLNVENAELDNFYNVVFVGKNISETIGRVYTDENGKGKAELALNLQELESKGFPIEKINGILITRDSNILLGGYIEKEDNSIERFIDGLKQEVPVEIEEVSEPIVEWREVEAIMPVFESELEPQQVEETNIEEAVEDILIYQKEAIEPTYEPLNEIIEELEVPQELEITEELETRPEVEIIEEFEAPQEIESVEEPEIEHTEFFSEEVARRVSQRNQTTNYILNILRFFPYIDPFSVKLEGYNWWKINFQEEIDTRGFLPYFSYIVGGSQKIKRTEDYITALDLLRKYEHYIFGLYNVKDDVKYYVYGIPGSLLKSEHPHNGTTGFNTWFEGLELEGYWLLYIDPLTGKVIYPANPMEPAN